MFQKKVFSFFKLDKLINKKRIFLAILVILSPLIILGLLCIYDFFCFNYIEYLPITRYEKNTESVNLLNICGKIQNSQSRELCFTIIKNKNFQESLKLVSETENYSLEHYPWYDFPFYSFPRYDYLPGGLEKALEQAKNYDSAWWCKEVYLPYTHIKEDYFFCRAFLENPHFCNKILYSIGPSKGICYQDAAFIWKDSILCEKAEYPDFCYIRLVLKYLEDIKKK